MPSVPPRNPLKARSLLSRRTREHAVCRRLMVLLDRQNPGRTSSSRIAAQPISEARQCIASSGGPASLLLTAYAGTGNGNPASPNASRINDSCRSRPASSASCCSRAYAELRTRRRELQHVDFGCGDDSTFGRQALFDQTDRIAVIDGVADGRGEIDTTI
jgi:hypothetical protein